MKTQSNPKNQAEEAEEAEKSMKKQRISGMDPSEEPREKRKLRIERKRGGRAVPKDERMVCLCVRSPLGIVRTWFGEEGSLWFCSAGMTFIIIIIIFSNYVLVFILFYFFLRL